MDDYRHLDFWLSLVLRSKLNKQNVDSQCDVAESGIKRNVCDFSSKTFVLKVRGFLNSDVIFYALCISKKAA